MSKRSIYSRSIIAASTAITMVGAQLSVPQLAVPTALAIETINSPGTSNTRSTVSGTTTPGVKVYGQWIGGGSGNAAWIASDIYSTTASSTGAYTLYFPDIKSPNGKVYPFGLNYGPSGTGGLYQSQFKLWTENSDGVQAGRVVYAQPQGDGMIRGNSMSYSSQNVAGVSADAVRVVHLPAGHANYVVDAPAN